MTRSFFARKSKAQASMEFLMVTMIGFAAVLIISYMVFNSVKEDRKALDEGKLEEFSNTLVTAADVVYRAGAGSRRTVAGSIPSQVVDLEVAANADRSFHEIIFSTNAQQYVFNSHTPINFTYLPNMQLGGMHSVVVEMYTEPMPFVLASFGGKCPISDFYDFDMNGIENCADFDILKSCEGIVRPRHRWDDRWYTCFQMDYDGDCNVSANTPLMLDADTWNQKTSNACV